MNVNIAFLFESVIRSDDLSSQKIEISSSIGSDLEFDFLIKQYNFFRDALKVIDQLVMLNSASTEYEKIEYKDWMAKEVIRKITSNTAVFDAKPDSVKDVLNELIQRRDKLASQIQDAMDFMDKSKGKIDDMKQIRADHWKVYLPPFISLSNQMLYIEALAELSNIYLQFGFDTTVVFTSEVEEYSPTEGFGWVEFSHNFSDDVKSLHYAEKMSFTNTKPRSDIRILGRSDQIISQIYQLKPLWLFNFENYNKFIIEAKKMEIPSDKISFNKTDLLDIVSLVHSSAPENSEITLLLQPSNSFSVEFSSSERVLTLHSSEIDNTKKVLINSTLFQILLPMVRYTTNIDLIVFGGYLPTYLIANLEFGFLLLSTNPHQTAIAQRYRLILERYMHIKNRNDNQEFSENLWENLSERQYFLSSQGYNCVSGEVIKRTLIENPLPIALSPKEKHGILVYQTYQKEVISQSNQISLESLHFQATVKIQDNGLVSTTECTCQQNHPQYNCEHVIACILFLLLKGDTACQK